MFIPYNNIPLDCRRHIMYGKTVVTYRPEKEDPNRTRLTVGGNRVVHQGNISTLGGPVPKSRQEFLCSSRNTPRMIGKKGHKKTFDDLPIFDQAKFWPASPPIFPLSLSDKG